MNIANRLCELSPHYDAFLVDIWGVVHDGVNPYPLMIESLNRLISEGKHVLFLSNAPRPGEILEKRLLEFGVQIKPGMSGSPDVPGMVLSSGDAVRQHLALLNNNEKIYHVGAERNQDLLSNIYSKAPLQITDSLENADIMLISAYMDKGEDLNQYLPLFQQAKNLNLPAICANPDKEVQNGKSLRYCAGFLAEQYKNMGGVVHYYGKPYRRIFELAIERLNLDLNLKLNLDKKKILMVGDTLENDIQGAINAGIDSAWVMTGNAEVLVQQSTLKQLFENHGVVPTWIIC